MGAKRRFELEPTWFRDRRWGWGGRRGLVARSECKSADEKSGEAWHSPASPTPPEAVKRW